MNAITGRDISHTYAGSTRLSLDAVGIDVAQGEWLAIVGHNGSGKSTLVKHFNALVALQSGEMTVANIDVRDASSLWALRRACGMVFQNPDNQFVSSIVGEDIAFGLENYEFPPTQVPGKIAQALRMVGMDGAEQRATHRLSGGQKQRVALAGVLALDADILIFDEATAMLDAIGKREVLALIEELHKQAGKTIVLITHDMDEAVPADRVLVMAHGKVLGEGTPRQILTDRTLLEKAALVPPMPVRMYFDLLDAGIALPRCPLTEQDLAEELCQLC